MNPYIGHPSQLCSATEKRLVGGKGDGMRVLDVKTPAGLSFTVSLDRCGDIPYLSFKGHNVGYIAPCGMVSPQYYDKEGTGFLKSFTAGFFTTCGLTSFGRPQKDGDGMTLMHGNISHVPAEQYTVDYQEDALVIRLTVRDASLFSHQLLLTREYICSLSESKINLCDTVENFGTQEVPFMILYHCNMGYPLLTENALLSIPSVKVTPCDARAKEGMDRYLTVEKPQADFAEQCYFHTFSEDPAVSLYNPDLNFGINMQFSLQDFPEFLQWKMMGIHEYVMGLEPCNCRPDNRDEMRKAGKLPYLAPGEKSTKRLTFSFFEK